MRQKTEYCLDIREVLSSSMINSSITLQNLFLYAVRHCPVTFWFCMHGCLHYHSATKIRLCIFLASFHAVPHPRRPDSFLPVLQLSKPYLFYTCRHCPLITMIVLTMLPLHAFRTTTRLRPFGASPFMFPLPCAQYLYLFTVS